MSMFSKLSAGGIAVVGRTGSGKSSMFYGSEYVLDVIIADTGSLAHRVHHRGGGECTVLSPADMDRSPVDYVRELVRRCEAESRLWCLDSWSALEWQQCAWYKAKHKKPSMSQPDHKVVVNNMRDLALELATGRGFTLFNSGMGGIIRTEDGGVIQSPKGALTGYPSLSGCAPGTETVLARWSSVWVMTPGTPDKSADEPSRTPRGMLLPWDDFRGGDYGSYTPIKDGYQILSAGTVPASGERLAVRMRVDPVSPLGTCHIDAMLRRIAEKYPDERKAPKRRKLAVELVTSENGHVHEPIPSGIE